MSESRQQRRARARREAFDRTHGEVLQSRTVRDLYVTYVRGRFKEKADEALADPMLTPTIQHAFYAGAASMLELMTRVSPEDVTEEQGVEMLTRLHEELLTYSRGLR